MSITTVNITSQSNAIINGAPTVITNWTYTLDMSNIVNVGVNIFNTTSPNVPVTIKFTNTSTYNKNQIIIKSNTITIDGTSQTLDLTNKTMYNGLIQISDGCSDIEIKNIDIKINSISTLNGNNIGWVCQGYMSNTTVTFTDCNVHSDDSINIINRCNGGICGGLNGFGTNTNTTNSVKLNFVTCSLISNNGNINIGNNFINNISIGGICGGSNVVSTSGGSTTNVELDFDTCNVTANNGNININSDDCGIVCGGGNGYNNGYNNASGSVCNINVNLNCINCNVESSSILINNSSTGGICGGANGSGNNYNLKGNINLNFNNCIVFSNENNITINGTSSGGICGGHNGMYNIGNVVLELTFTNCNLESSSGIIINTTKNGGICGGNNTITVTFINCILYYSNLITFEGQAISAVTFFYLITVSEPLYIIGITNSNTLHLDNLSRIASSNPSGLTYNNPSIFTVGHPTETIIPSIVNEGIFALTYSISPLLPASITLDANTGIITVNPTNFLAPNPYTVTATYNTTAFIESTPFSIQIDDVPPSGLSYSSATNIFTVNTLITPMTPSFNGPSPTGTLTYMITPSIPGPSIPAGLILDINTGVITGTPQQQQPALIYTVTVTNDAGSKTAKISIQINDVVPIGLSYSSATNIFTVNTLITPLTPILTNETTVTGELTYSITPSIPIGLNFNINTGVITGTPLPQHSDTLYTITVSNISGATTTALNIQIKDVAPTGLLYPPKLELIVNKQINNIILPTISNQNTVTGTLTYSISPSIPAGLNLNNNTGEITGTPIKEQSDTLYTITVSNLSGFSTFTIIIEIIHLCKEFIPDPPNLWSRATLSCVNYDAYTSEQLAMRRKAEILNYKGNKNPLTKKQQWSRIVKGNGPLGKKVWATQNDLGSNPNVFNLQQVGNTLILCPDNNTDNNNYTLSSTLIGNISNFGKIVSISGDGNTLAIGSSSQQTVYVYTKNINNTWSVAATLYEPTITSFGSSLQLSYDGNTLITGAYLHSFFLIEDGRIFIYEKIASVWTQTFIYTGANTEQRLGKSVSISNDGSVIAVGSQFDNNVTYNGKIEVFERNGPHWNSAVPIGPIPIAYGLNSEQLSDSGIFLSGNGNFIAATTVVNKIYVYKKNGVSWSSGNTSQTLTISSDDNVYFDTNANYLCIGTLSGNIAYVYKYNTTTSLFEPQQSFNNLDGTSSTVIIISPDGKYVAIGLPQVNSNTGVVYIYKIINNTWNLIQKIYGDRINSLFGKSLSFDNDGYTLAIGASSADAQPGKVYIYFRNGTDRINNTRI